MTQICPKLDSNGNEEELGIYLLLFIIIIIIIIIDKYMTKDFKLIKFIYRLKSVFFGCLRN
jgi:hypothetical protein